MALTVNRGTTYRITGVYNDEDDLPVDISAAVIRFTVKEAQWDTDDDDSDASITKTASITDGPNGEYLITLTDTDTYIAKGKYYYDIKVELANGDINLLDSGRFVVKGSPTNRTA